MPKWKIENKSWVTITYKQMYCSCKYEEEKKFVIHGKIHINSIFFLCILHIRIIILRHRNTTFEEILFEKDTITRQKKSFE